MLYTVMSCTNGVQTLPLLLDANECRSCLASLVKRSLISWPLFGL